MSIWSVTDDTFAQLECSFIPYCYYCKETAGIETPMRNTCIKLLRFALNDGKTPREESEKNSHAIDVEIACPRCGLWEVFGVAIDRKHWERIKKDATEILETQKKERDDRGNMEENKRR